MSLLLDDLDDSADLDLDRSLLVDFFFLSFLGLGVTSPSSRSMETTDRDLLLDDLEGDLRL